MSDYLSRDDILQASDLKTQDVEVPEWGGTVRIRSLRADEREEYEQAVADSRDEGDSVDYNIRARLVAASVVNGEGEREFSLDDVAALGKKNARALHRVFDAALHLSGITEDDVEELEGNLESATSGGSVST